VRYAFATLACLAALAAAADADARWQLDSGLTAAAGAPVRCYDQAGITRTAARVIMADDYTHVGAFYWPLRNSYRIALRDDYCASLRALAAGYEPEQERLAGLLVFVLARELAHGWFNDAAHGHPGHNDHRASSLAMRHFDRVGTQLGIRQEYLGRARVAFYHWLGLPRLWPNGEPPLVAQPVG
jgi:hypothetical protein